MIPACTREAFQASSESQTLSVDSKQNFVACVVTQQLTTTIDFLDTLI